MSDEEYMGATQGDFALIERLRAELAAEQQMREGLSEEMKQRRDAYVLRERELEAELAAERHSASVSDQCCVAEMNARKNAEAERDALRELLREAVMQLPEHRRKRFDAALGGSHADT